MAVFALLTFPLAYYEGFSREHQYELSNLDLNGWMREFALSWAVQIAVSEDIYQFDGSRQSDRISANVSGLFGTTRFALSDTTLAYLSPEAVKAVRPRAGVTTCTTTSRGSARRSIGSPEPLRNSCFSSIRPSAAGSTQACAGRRRNWRVGEGTAGGGRRRMAGVKKSALQRKIHRQCYRRPGSGETTMKSIVLAVALLTIAVGFGRRPGRLAPQARQEHDQAMRHPADGDRE